jgi:hypothetical protein
LTDLKGQKKRTEKKDRNAVKAIDDRITSKNSFSCVTKTAVGRSIEKPVMVLL